MQTSRNIHCQLSNSIGHDENHCRSYELMMEHGTDTYRMQVEEHGHEDNGQCSSRVVIKEEVEMAELVQDVDRLFVITIASHDTLQEIVRIPLRHVRTVNPLIM